MKLSKLVPATEIAVQIGAETVRVWAAAERMTFDTWNRAKSVNEASAEEDRLLATAEILSVLIAKWDLEEDDGSPVPITPERLSNLPVGVLTPIMTAVFETLNPTDAAPAS
jgi:hypothetical protein